MKIGELAKQTDCAVETIRYYERENLLPEPARSDGNYRVYTQVHAERLTFIRNCRTLDMTLEIRALLTLRDSPQDQCESVNALIDEHILHVKARIDGLLALQTQLLDLRQRCGEDRKWISAGSCSAWKSVAGWWRRRLSIRTWAVVTAIEFATTCRARPAETRECPGIPCRTWSPKTFLRRGNNCRRP